MGSCELIVKRSILLKAWCWAAVFFGFASLGQCAEHGTFAGSWSASGKREVLGFGDGRQTALIRLQGHVNLKDGIGTVRDYWSNCIGLSDTKTGSSIRCVWTGADKEEIYVVLKAEKLDQGTVVTGEFAGGTKGADGIRGTLSFTWSTLFIHQSGETQSIGGYAKELQGAYSLP